MDLSNLLKNMSLNKKANVVLDSIQNLPKANGANTKYLDGEVIKGEVIDLKGLVADIITSEGVKLKGHLQTVGQLNIGDERLSVVKNENGQVKFGIVHEDNETLQNKSIKNELISLGLKGNEEDIETAKTLIKNELPVNKETLNNLTRALNIVSKDQDSLDKALFLLKNNIPLTKDNSVMLDNFISKEINTLSTSNEIEQDVLNLKDSNLKNAIITILNGEDEIFESSKEKIQMIDKEIKDLSHSINKETIEQVAKDVKNTASNENVAQKLGEVIDENFLKPDSDIFEHEKSVAKFIDKNINHTLEKELTKDVLKFSLEPESNDKKEIDRFLNETNNKLDKAIKLLEDLDSPEAKKLLQTMTTQKNSIEFMNFSKNNLYLQMPININQNQTNGELLVFKDRKSGKKNDGSVSAIIGLDTVNLGRYETYIAKTGNSLELQFRLENDEIINLTKKYLSKLLDNLSEHNLVISKISYKKIEDAFTITTKEESITNDKENSFLPNYNFNVKL